MPSVYRLIYLVLSSFTFRFLALPLRVKGSVAAQAKLTKKIRKKKPLAVVTRAQMDL